jgi:predicted permease
VFFIAKVPVVDLAPSGTLLDDVLTALIGSVNFLSEMVTPLAMIVIGIKLAGANFKKLFLDKSAYYVCLLKLFVMSIVSILAVAFLPISTFAKYAIFFTLSMPSATSTVLFSEQFGGDSESASVFVLMSTVLSILTIPLMFMLFSAVVII